MQYRRYQAVFHLFPEGGGAYEARYSSLHIGNESTRFRLSVNGHSGTAADALRYPTANWRANGRPFSTPDRDNDCLADGSCAEKSGWWFCRCGAAALNNPCRGQPDFVDTSTALYRWWPIAWNKPLRASDLMVKPAK